MRNSKYRLKPILFITLISIASYAHAQQNRISLYPVTDPGSENWSWNEKEFFVDNPLNATVSYNVSRPTLTVFAPDSANGTAVIICPGGGFFLLNVETEGSKIAKELNKKGITVFLLRYRVVRSLTDNPWQEMMKSMKDSAGFQQKISAVKQLATADTRAAVKYVREYASTYNIDPGKIGLLGFSAGGTLVLNNCINVTTGVRPDFVGFVYTLYTPNEENVIPWNAPPAFIVSASDDKLAHPSNSINLYNGWLASGNAAELHIYENGGHGLKGFPATTWLHRFMEWIDKKFYSPTAK